METAVVLGAAIAVTGLIAWWFFAPRRVSVAGEEAGVELARITVQGGYSPSNIQVRSGRPIKLVFNRQESGECSSHVIFSDLGVDRELPAYATTELDLGPLKPGEYPFACGMNMLHGTLTVVKS